MREANHKLTLLPFPPRNDLSLLVEFIPFLNKNADPFSTTTSMSFLESKLTKTAKSQPIRSWLKKKKELSKHHQSLKLSTILISITPTDPDDRGRSTSRRWPSEQTPPANPRTPRRHRRRHPEKLPPSLDRNTLQIEDSRRASTIPATDAKP